MIEVELPDGSIAEFPDGTSNDVIKGALQKRFAPTQPQAPEAPPSPQFQEAMAGMSAATQNPARAAYDNMPGWQKPLVAASDLFQLAGSGASFGFGEKAAAAVRAPFTDKSYEEELAAQRGLTQGARNRAGGAGTVAEIGGAIAAPMGLAGKGLTLAGRLGTGVMKGAGGLAARTGLMGLEGAGYGALTAAGNDQDLVSGAGIGALGGAGGNLLGEGLSALGSKVAGLFNKKPAVPSIDDLRAAQKAAYQAVDDAGLTYSATQFDDLVRGMTDEVKAANISPMRHPKAASMMADIQSMAGSNPTLTQLDQLRQTISRDVAQSNDPAERFFGSKMISNIDEFIASNGGGDELMKARELTGRVKKLEKIGKAQEVAEISADVSGSGANIDNATRQRIAAILKNDKLKRGFTAEELAAMKDVTRDSGGQKALRLAGKFAPTGVVSGVLSGGAGMAALGPLGVAVPVAGAVAKTAADNITKRKVDELVKIIAAGSKSATQTAPNAVQQLSKAKRDAIARILMGLAVKQGVAPAGAQ